MAYQKILDAEYIDTDLSGKMYRVYKNGTVVSLASGVVVQQRLSKDGYNCFTAGKKGNRTCYYTHRVVGKLFLEKPSDADKVQYELNHLDTDRTNPCADNLAYVTHEENVQYSVERGHYKGKKCGNNPNAKLSSDEVAIIKLLLDDGVTVYEIAKRFGRGWQTINHIKQGTTWQ